MSESQLILQEIKSDLQSALKGVRELEKTDDIDSPSADFCERLAKAVEDAVSLI